MGHKRGKLARFEDGVKAMSAHEREALRRAMQAAQEDPAMLSRITAIAAARGEAVRKRASDRRTDAARSLNVVDDPPYPGGGQGAQGSGCPLPGSGHGAGDKPLCLGLQGAGAGRRRGSGQARIARFKDGP